MAVVLVTGASSGFGVAIAEAFARRGHSVVGGMRDPAAKGHVLLDAVPTAEAVALDVTVDASRRAAVDEVLGRHGTVDVLVNNAGVLHVASVEDTPSADFERIVQTNFVGPIELSRLVLPAMRTQGSGRIVSVTAIGAVLCTPFLAAYVASKHAMDAAMAALDLEVRPFGIRALSVLPGSFKTNIAAAASPGRDSEAYADAGAAFRAGFTARIEGAPDDLSPVADAVLRAATEERPTLRRVVAAPPMAEVLAPVVAQLDDLHRAEAERLGIPI